MIGNATSLPLSCGHPLDREGTMNKRANERIIRGILLFFMLALAASGLSAIPLRWEVGLLDRWFGAASFMQQVWPSMAGWIGQVNVGVQNGYGQYPFLAYGTDWLAFGHVAIALAFIGGRCVIRIRNVWVVEFGMMACALVIPWALVFGAVRGIPIFWTVVDMCFWDRGDRAALVCEAADPEAAGGGIEEMPFAGRTLQRA